MRFFTKRNDAGKSKQQRLEIVDLEATLDDVQGAISQHPNPAEGHRLPFPY